MVDEAVESRKAGAAEGQVVYPSIIRSIQDPSAQALLRSDNLVDRQKINVLGDWDCSIGFFCVLTKLPTSRGHFAGKPDPRGLDADSNTEKPCAPCQGSVPEAV